MEDKDLTADMEMLASKEDEMYGLSSPKGRFTDRGLNILVKATNTLLPLFSQDPSYPTFAKGEYKELPADFMRILSMFASASTDALASGDVDPEMSISFEEIDSDEGLISLATKIQMLAKSKPFKTFLKTPKVEKEMEAPVEEAGEAEMNDDQINALFMSRMK